MTQERTSVDVGGHPTLPGPRIWSATDVHGRSGNTLIVSGSRPGRPAMTSERSRSYITKVATLSNLNENLSSFYLTRLNCGT